MDGRRGGGGNEEGERVAETDRRTADETFHSPPRRSGQMMLLSVRLSVLLLVCPWRTPNGRRTMRRDETRRIAYGTTRTGNGQWILQKSIPAPLQQVTDSLWSFWSTRDRPEDVNDDAWDGPWPSHSINNHFVGQTKFTSLDFVFRGILCDLSYFWWLIGYCSSPFASAGTSDVTWLWFPCWRWNGTSLGPWTCV